MGMNSFAIQMTAKANPLRCPSFSWTNSPSPISNSKNFWMLHIISLQTRPILLSTGKENELPLVRKNFPSPTFLTKTQKLTHNGQGSDYPPKSNGSMLHKQVN